MLPVQLSQGLPMFLTNPLGMNERGSNMLARLDPCFENIVQFLSE